jgi:predicted PurR-regulated permease PerM
MDAWTSSHDPTGPTLILPLSLRGRDLRLEKLRPARPKHLPYYRSMHEGSIAPKTSRFSGVASLCIIVAGLYFAREVLVPIAVALLFTFLLAPLVNRLEHMHVPRVGAVLFVVLLAFALIGGIGWTISSQAADLAGNLGEYKGDIEHRINEIKLSYVHGALAQATRTLTEVAQDVATSQPAGVAGTNTLPTGTESDPLAVRITSAPQSSTSTIEIVESALLILAPLMQSLIVVIFVIFMLIQREDLRDRLIRLVGHGSLTLTTRALDDAGTRVSGYLVAQSMINVSVGIVLGIGLYLLHVPNGPLWGLLCALLRFIPYIGIWIGAALPLILSIVVPEGAYAARPFLTAGLFVGVEALASNIIEPYLLGAKTGLSPLAILVAAVFWSWLWGPVGLLLSTPLTVVLAVVGRYVAPLRFLDVLLGDEPVLELHERYYQRLLAGHAEEAAKMLDDFAKGHSAEELYSRILLPALRLTEQDSTHGRLDDELAENILHFMREHLALHAPKERKEPIPGQTNQHLPEGCVINIACLAAHDEADEIAGLMFVNLLNEQGYCATQFATDTLAGEAMETIERTRVELVVISALPPGATSHARYLCKRLAPKFPELRLLIALWTATGDIGKARKRISDNPAVKIATQLSEALEVVRQMVQPLLIRIGDAAAEESKNGPQPAPLNPVS